MRRSEFDRAVADEFGDQAGYLLTDLSLPDAGGRSATAALAAGVPPREVWLALCAESCRLAARRGMSRPLRSTMVPPSRPSISPAPAEITIAMPAMTAKAANRLPLTPKRKPLTRNLDSNAICPLPRLRYLGMFPGAAVSRYPVNSFGKTKPFLP